MEMWRGRWDRSFLLFMAASKKNRGGGKIQTQGFCMQPNLDNMDISLGFIAPFQKRIHKNCAGCLYQTDWSFPNPFLWTTSLFSAELHFCILQRFTLMYL